MALEDLRDDEGLEHVTCHSSALELLWRIPSRKMTRETRIHEVQLWRLGQAPCGVCPKRLQNTNDTAGLEDQDPTLDGLHADVDVIGHVARVE